MAPVDAVSKADVPGGGLRLSVDVGGAVLIDVPGYGSAWVVVESTERGRACLRFAGPIDVRFHRVGSSRGSPATG